MGKYDEAYKYLFSNKTIFKELIECFVKEDFVKDIDFKQIELVDKSFVTDDFLKRESDVIYKLKINDAEAYIYILLEFQSTVDKSIPVRMLLYLIQFYDLLLRNSQKGKLPNVFPVMMYNGFDEWNIPSNVKDLIDNRIPMKYIPDFEYYKIIINDIPEESLLKLHNLVSAMMYLEKNKDEKKLREVIKNVIELIREENILDVKMFARWINRIFEKNICDEEIEKIKDITEVKSMLETLVENIKKEGIKETEILIAKKMLKDKISIEIISKYTGLSLKEIEELK